MGSQVELVGEAADIGDFVDAIKLAELEDLEIVDGDAGRKRLAGSRFDSCATAGGVMEKAREAVDLLNGLSTLSYMHHRPIAAGTAVYDVHPDSRQGCTVFVPGVTVRTRAGFLTAVTHADGAQFDEAPRDKKKDFLAMVAQDPRYRQIIEILGKERTWPRLRVALEQLTALIGKSRKDIQAIWNNGYATREEITNLKKNIEDPRHSGIDAVHGVPDGPLQGTKMTVEQGFDLLVRLLKAAAEKGAP